MNRRRLFLTRIPLLFKKSRLSTIFYDEFTDTNGTSLATHTPNIDLPGNGWIVDRGPYTVESNKAATTQSGGIATANVEVSDCIICCHKTQIKDNNKVGLMARYAASNSNWWIYMQEDLETYSIVEYSGVETVRASTSVAIAEWTDYDLQVILNGTTITATLNGANEISYASATRALTATKHGIRGQNLRSTHDNFEIIA